MSVIGQNERGQVTINGQPRFARLLYDTPVVNDWPAQFAERDLLRFQGKLDFYLNVQVGEYASALKLADALEPLGMRTFAIGNAFAQWLVNPAFDVVANPTYEYDGVTQPFCEHWRAHPRACGVYLGDEPHFTDELLADLEQHQELYHQRMPELPTMTVFLNDNPYQFLAWNDRAIGDWVGCDIYTVGRDAEGTVCNETYGYMNFSVGEAAALGRYYAALAGRVPLIILQAFKFGGASRFITRSENLGHMAAGATELGGVGVIGWWAMGIQEGAMDHSNAGVDTFTPEQREDFCERLDWMMGLLAELEPIMVQPPSPDLVTALSTRGPDALAQRIELVDRLRDGGGDRPCWLWGAVERYQDEYERLTQTPPDTSLSDHMLDQAGPVRLCAWEAEDTGLVSLYNIDPDPQPFTARWHRKIVRVEVVGEDRDVPVTGDGHDEFADTAGGASSLRQGEFSMGHIYRLHLEPTTPTPEPPTPGTGWTVTVDATIRVHADIKVTPA